MKKYIFLLLLGATFTLHAQEIKLDVPIVIQEQDEWCGAAVSRSVLSYLPPHKVVAQCVIMEWVRQGMPPPNSNQCCEFPLKCNDGIDLYGSRSVQSVLSYFGEINSNPHSAKYPEPGEIETYLRNNRPLIINVRRLSNYTNHAVVVRGMHPKGEGFGTIYYMDPSNVGDNGGYKEVSWFNLINGWDDNNPYIWQQTLIPCLSSKDDPCGDLPPPPLPTTCSNCKKNDGEVWIDCGGPCPPCEDVPEERIITETKQLDSVVVALKKITAKNSVQVKSGENVSFITEKTGSIVLLPGFRAMSGSNFSM